MSLWNNKYIDEICIKVFKLKTNLTPVAVNPISGRGPKGASKLTIIAPNKSNRPTKFHESNRPHKIALGFFIIW